MQAARHRVPLHGCPQRARPPIYNPHAHSLRHPLPLHLMADELWTASGGGGGALTLGTPASSTSSAGHRRERLRDVAI